jgi:hypothetical protein
MHWVRELHQTLSYNMGYGLGCRGFPYKCPWWVDKTICSFAYAKGRKAYLNSIEKESS